MATFELSDGSFELRIEGDTVPSVMEPNSIAVLYALAHLCDTLPLDEYGITRSGEDDIWTITATAIDTREYASTVTITDSIPYYTLTSLPQGTIAEVAAFLGAARAFAAILKEHEISAVTAQWTA